MASPQVAASPALTNVRVLIAEDDPEVAQSLDLFLQLLSCRVDIASDGSQALDRAVRGNYDLIVLDVSLPVFDGLAVCKTIRRREIFTPILMLTARASEGDKVIGLNSGADDYLTKPFSPIELHARLNALVRRARHFPGKQSSGSCLEFEGLTIDIERRLVTLQDRPVDLTAKEFDLLVVMARHPGRVFTREQLLDAVWGYGHDGYGHTVNSHVNRLRAKLEADPAHPRYIVTVWSVGYRFCER